MLTEKHIKFSVSKEMIAKGAYWILMKFNADKFHRALDSAKRDKFGGYLERWLNKVFEKPFFDNFLQEYNKNYSVIYDDLIYKDHKLKTAPDVLGLKLNEKIIPFGKYTDRWMQHSNMPKIEIKSFRKDQNVATTNANQTADYYIFLETDLDDDYLKSIFSNDFYDEKNFEEIIENWKDLEQLFEDNSNVLINIDKPVKKLNNFSVELLSIVTHDDWLELSKIAKGAVKESNRIKVQPEKPKYFKFIEKNENPSHHSRKNPLGNKNLLNLKLDNNNLKYLLPVFEPVDNNRSNSLMANFTGSSKSTIYFEIGQKFKLNGEVFNPGKYKITFAVFDRSAGFNEHCALKNAVKHYDSREKLLNCFDQIIKNN